MERVWRQLQAVTESTEQALRVGVKVDGRVARKGWREEMVGLLKLLAGEQRAELGA